VASAPVKTRTVVASVVDVLKPYIGETMARSSARAQCAKLGISEDGVMTEEQAEALAARLAAALKVFLPKERCTVVVARLRRAMGLPAGTRTSNP
jgi:hypothetical protein